MNRLEEDTAWHPVMKEEYETFPNWLKVFLRAAMGPLRTWASIGHWLVFKERKREMCSKKTMLH